MRTRCRRLRVSRNPGASAEKLLAYLWDRGGVLVERGNGLLSIPAAYVPGVPCRVLSDAAELLQEVARLARLGRQGLGLRDVYHGVAR
jgi:hypothetical protein